MREQMTFRKVLLYAMGISQAREAQGMSREEAEKKTVDELVNIMAELRFLPGLDAMIDEAFAEMHEWKKRQERGDGP